MRLGDSSPDNSESCVVLDTLALIDESDLLSKVKACVFLVVDTLDLEQSELFMLSGLASFESDESSLVVQSKQLSETSKVVT